MTDLVGVSDDSISASDLAYAASGSNTYLSQATVQGTIKADPLEFYVFSGASYHFYGKDFLGNSVKKLVDSSTTDVQKFNSIQSALDAAATNSDVTEIRVAVNHNETSSGEIEIKSDDLKIDFWDAWDPSANRLWWSSW